MAGTVLQCTVVVIFAIILTDQRHKPVVSFVTKM
jgi:hypothetical protein